jgi:AcrR family transcriptional regulator
VFARYGYRKTSFDQVAQTAGASRQGLYLHFPSKEALFRAAVEHALSRHLSAAVAALSKNEPLADRLVAACDEWAGGYVGRGTPDAQDLAGVSASITGEILATYGARFEEALAVATAESLIMKTYVEAGLTAQVAARTLHMTVQGIKQQSLTHQAFHIDLKTAVAVLLASSPRSRRTSS